MYISTVQIYPNKFFLERHPINLLSFFLPNNLLLSLENTLSKVNAIFFSKFNSSGKWKWANGKLRIAGRSRNKNQSNSR